jgi:hypothetical protein
MCDGPGEGECAWFRRAVRRVKNSAFLVHRNSVRNRSSVEVAGDGAKESRAQWLNNFVYLIDLLMRVALSTQTESLYLMPRTT